MHRYFFILAVASLLLPGCRTPQTIKEAWKGTRSYYYEYLNTPARLDLDDTGDALDYQAQLGSAIADFDLQLRELEKVLQNSDRRPDTEWVTAMSTRFPWLSGIALTDEEGVPRAKVPTDFPKPFEIGNLTAVDAKQQLKDLRAFVQYHELGPEIYVGNPVYIGADFKGVITVHFDPRVLLSRTGDPAKVMIAAPGGIIWPGMYDAAATPVAGADWGEVVRTDHAGIVENESGTFYWICRYLGNLPLIYAIKIDGEFPPAEENMRGLADANAFALGRVDLSQLQTRPGQEAPGLAVVPGAPGDAPIEITPDGQNSPLTTPEGTAPDTPDAATPLSE